MFEIDIQKERHNGVMLHRRDREEYWKLMLTCSRDGCDNDVDMGECLCFSDKSMMTNCRDNHGLHCSTKCWHKDSTREKIDKVLNDIKKNNESCISSGDIDCMIQGDDELELISNFFDSLAENMDAWDFLEDYDITECSA